MGLHTFTELELFAFSLIADFLKERELTNTLESLQLEAGDIFDRLERFQRPHGKPLLTVLEEHESGELSGNLQRLALDRQYDSELNQPGPTPIPQLPPLTLENVHHANILTVTSRTVPTSLFPTLDPSTSPTTHVILTGSTDKTARITDAKTGALLSRLDHHKSAILAVDFHPQNPLNVLTAGMDGAAHIVNIQTGEPLQSFHDHTKYIVRAQFSPFDNGLWLVTASYDRTVQIYKQIPSSSSSPTPTYQKYHTVTLPGAIESFCFLPPHPPTHPHITLVLGSRDDHRLHHIDLDPSAPTPTSLKTYTTNMNQNGDSWVSFVPMDLSPSPSGNFLAVYTDSKAGRIIIFASRSDRQVRNLYGTVADGFSRPRIGWDKRGRVVVATSDDRQIYLFDVGSGE
ncbi:hypothetical protein HK097_001276, partial [Rhizophlyctis rosea]